MISIVITCYNYDSFVSKAIESAINQKYEKKEIIVVDDGSTDNSWHVIQNYRDHILAIRTENKGSIQACLTGLQLSRGEFLHFLDADDVLQPEATATLALFCRPDVSKIQFPMHPIDSQGNIIGAAFPLLDSSLRSEDLIQLINSRGTYTTPPTSGNVFSRKIFDYVDGITYERAVDGVTCLVAPFLGSVVTVAEPLASYRVHPKNHSSLSSLTSARFEMEGNRFVSRLHHLADISHRHELVGLAEKHDPQSFSYARERRILACIADGRRPVVLEILGFIRAICRERYGWSRSTLSVAWSLLVLVSSSRMLARLATLRANPWSRGRALALLKAHVLSARPLRR